MYKRQEGVVPTAKSARVQGHEAEVMVVEDPAAASPGRRAAVVGVGGVLTGAEIKIKREVFIDIVSREPWPSYTLLLTVADILFAAAAVVVEVSRAEVP